jgi:HK97 family phage prohead protease
MPLPTPNSDESQDDFVSRCMANDTMTAEYPDEDQRAAVCYSQWENRAAPSPTIRRMAMRASMAIAEDDDRAVTVTCSTEMLGRDKIVLVSRGIDLSNYRSNPIWLWQHNADWPVARSQEIGVQGDDLVARVQFPPVGVSERADEVLGLIRAGVINAASTGFEKVQAEPIDAANPRSGTRIVSCELAEMSFVSIPAVPNALVTERTAELVDHAHLVAMKRGIIKRGLYEVGHLAYVLEELGWLKSSVEWEASIEEDNSPVPAQLADALKALGAVLVSMTAEEVAEMVGGGEAAEEVPVAVDTDEAAIITASATPALARFRIGVHRARMPAMKEKPAVVTREATSMARHRRMAALFARELAAD